MRRTDPTNPETIVIRSGDEDVATHDETVRVADQDFEIPSDAYAVRMQVGDMPLTVVGWITAPEALAPLLRSVANENEKTLGEWNAATSATTGGRAPEAETGGSGGRHSRR